MSSVLSQYNAVVEHTARVDEADVFKDSFVFPWQIPYEGTVSIFTKKKVFDSVMAVKRLEEEEVVLLNEMRQHWRTLSQRLLLLKNMMLEKGEYEN